MGCTSPPLGSEIARHTHEGQTYVLVEYGNELAIFSASGAPVGERELAEDILRSYAWRQSVGDFDTGELTDVSQKVRRLDDNVSEVRVLSNDMVGMFDLMDEIKGSVPLLGSVTAMDVVRDTYPGVGEAERLIRALDSELNDLGDNTESLAEALEGIGKAEPTPVSGEEMEALFTGAANAARDLQADVNTVKGSVSEVRESVSALAGALRAGGDTPLIGDALADFARSAERLELELSDLSSLLGGFESELDSLGRDLQSVLDSASGTLRVDLERWLAEPYDSQWPPN